jgi:dUTP pyrophosphatase
MKTRGFEVASGFEDKGINLPVRKTKNSAGYDIEAAEDTIIPPFKSGMKPTLVKTGLKAYCEPDEFYMLCNRSSNPGKRGLVLANSVGIIDSDYYENPDNDGHFMFAYYNFFDHDIEIKKGDVVGQAIFMKYLTVDNDNATRRKNGRIWINR